MGKLELLRKFRAAARDPARLGDAAIYKSELGHARARPEVEAAILALAEPLPRLDLDELGALARGTLGRETVEFLRARDLSPFRSSRAIEPELVRRNIFVARYSLVHDIVHVLTGFDTSWAGELGVWSFIAAQRYARAHAFAVAFACLLYPLWAPRQIPRLWHNLHRGRAMGRQARRIIAVPFEQLWTHPVAVVRRELAIEPAHELDEELVTAPS